MSRFGYLIGCLDCTGVTSENYKDLFIEQGFLKAKVKYIETMMEAIISRLPNDTWRTDAPPRDRPFLAYDGDRVDILVWDGNMYEYPNRCSCCKDESIVIQKWMEFPRP